MASTLLEIRDQIKDDLDLQESDWKTDAQLNALINRHVKKTHRKIINIYEDYFLAPLSVALDAADDYIDYPSDIYANKIKSIHFTWDLNSCEILPVKRFDRELIDSNVLNGESTSPYRRWLSVDSATDGRRINLYPSSGETGTVNIWYIREATELSNDTDICNMYEFCDYIIQCVKTAYYALDGDPRYKIEKSEELELERDLVNTLTNMNVGNDDTVIADYSHYEDSV